MECTTEIIKSLTTARIGMYTDDLNEVNERNAIFERSKSIFTTVCLENTNSADQNTAFNDLWCMRVMWRCHTKS